MDQELPKLGHYALLLQLGHTAEYQAYLARDDRSGRLVALRQARPTLDPTECAPLIRTLSGLVDNPHPHLPQVVEVGTDEDTLFWAADYVEGDTLDTLRRQSSFELPVPVALRIGLDVASALQELSLAGDVGAILAEDVLIGVDGAARLIPSATRTAARRREVSGFTHTLQATAPEVGCLAAFVWECLASQPIDLAQGRPKLPELPPEVPPHVAELLRAALSEGSPATTRELRSFVTALSQSDSRIAPRSHVAEWLAERIHQRLQMRARVLSKDAPRLPSGEIPLVDAPPDPVEGLVASSPPSSSPTSSVRGSKTSVQPQSKLASRPTQERPVRAPLETALAEYAERIGKDRSSSH